MRPPFASVGAFAIMRMRPADAVASAKQLFDMTLLAGLQNDAHQRLIDYRRRPARLAHHRITFENAHLR